MLMKSKSLMLVLLFLASSLLVLVPIESELEESAPITESGVTTQWTMSDGPGIQNGWFAEVWQPATKGAVWDIEFSPDGTKIAAVEIADNRLFVWNVSDGRVLLWIHHSAAMVSVVWLSNDWVLAADNGINWYSYQVIDSGSSKPHDSTQMRSGQWTDSMTGTYDGWLWGLDASIDHSEVAFCGDINHMNMGGEVVVADIAHFIDGSPHNAHNLFTQYWVPDCAISTNGGTVAALGRNMTTHPDGNVSFRDVVYGVSASNGSLLWERHVAGPNSTAWAITWEPGGGSYTIAYNHPSPSQPNQWEGVASSYAESDGALFWYSPVPQNISSLAWLPDGSYLTLGLFNPGKISIASGGQIQTDFGWHSVISNNTGQPEDVKAVATTMISTTSTANQLIASAGKDGAIEIWKMDVTNFEITPYRRFGPRLVREIAISPNRDMIAVAESSGTLTIRSGVNGSILSQCFHPEYGQLVYSIPFAKSVGWQQHNEAYIGFSDGVMLSCNLNGKLSWVFDLRQYQTVGAFGRINMHPQGLYAAISWSSNTTNTSRDGHIAIIDPLSGQFLKEWQYSESHWTIKFNDIGGLLASVGQSGAVRLWNTSDPSPQNWIDDGSPYSHNGYVGVINWFPGMDLLITAGWDKQMIIWDIQFQTQIQNTTLMYEPFSISPPLNDGSMVVGTGDASTSQTGQLEFYDLQNNTLSSVYTINHIPRGFGLLFTGDTLALMNHTGTLLVLNKDADGDGWMDSLDYFPNDPTQHYDGDGDGWGDDQSQTNGDACLNTPGTSYADRNGCPDLDGDGYSDPDASWLASPNGTADAFLNNPAQWWDSDGDGYGDEYSYQVGNDGLRVGEAGDAFSNDATQYRDLDGDGCGDNYTYGNDNGMRINEAGDAFISDATQCNDFDGDGFGDNYTFTVGQGDLRTENGDAFPTDYLAWSDLDGDGCPIDSATGLSIDLYPTDSQHCDEDLPFWLPVGLQAVITNDANLWRVQVMWASAANNTDLIRLEAALTDNETTVTESDYFPIQVWTTFDSVDESIQVDPVVGKHRLHIRLIAIPDDGNSLSRNWTAVWVDTNISVGNGSGDGTQNNNNNNDADGDGIIDSADNCPNDPGLPENQGCPASHDTNNQTGSGDQSKGGAQDTSALWYIVIGLSMLALIILLIMAIRYNRKTDDIAEGVYSMAQAPPSVPPSPTMHPPCKTCGGFVQEVMHQSNLWTWCPSCSEWQDFLGKK
jgi:hypothetical protein